MNLYEPYPPERNFKQWLTGQRHDGSFDYDAERWRTVEIIILSWAVTVGTILGWHRNVQVILLGLCIGLALKSFVARRFKE